MKVGVIVFPGSNCDADAGSALQSVLGAGAEQVYLWHGESTLSGVDAVVVPGGFSYGDALRAGAIARFAPIMEAVARFASDGGTVLGICNGFQILCEARLLPGALVRNQGLRFVCRHIYLRVENNETHFTAQYAPGEVLRVPIAHGEGRYVCDDETHARLVAQKRVVFRYCDANGSVTPEANPNGARDNIAGIVGGPRNNVLGMMPHPERAASACLGGEDGRRLLAALGTVSATPVGGNNG